MLRRTPLILASSLMLLALVGCGSGSDTAGASFSCAQGGTEASGGEALCLVSCNLGCTQAGCAINQIAQNKPIVLVFNQNVDPTSVTTSSVSLRTSAGEEPVGRYFVTGPTVTFLPEVRNVGANAFFGFTADEEYFMTLPGGPDEINALRAASGDRLDRTYTCNLRVSQGIEDLNAAPPTARIVTPTQTSEVDPNTAIVLEFDEFIDFGPFVNAGSTNQPIKVELLPLNLVPTTECDTSVPPLEVRGTWGLVNDPIRRVTVATFDGEQQISSSTCVRIRVTGSVRDLAGNPSTGQVFQFFTTVRNQPVTFITEKFDNSLNFDPTVSTGVWRLGNATPGILGGDGLHGEFDASLGQLAPVQPPGKTAYVWDLDTMVIPQDRTLSGRNEPLTSGILRFTRFELDANTVVRFVGSNPVRVFVRGECIINGEIDLDGQSLSEHNGLEDLGQDGGVAGAGGGTGGRGADKADGVSPEDRFDGQPGLPPVLPMTGHANETAIMAMGGEGSPIHPPEGTEAKVGFSILFLGFPQLSGQIAAGGGGAGGAEYRMLPFVKPATCPPQPIISICFPMGSGQPFGCETMHPMPFPAAFGQVVTANTGLDYGKEANPGGAIDLYAHCRASASDPACAGLPGGVTNTPDHFLVGGGGGGGAGAHPFLSSIGGPPLGPTFQWHSGGGGGGGGGAIALRVGADLTMAAGSSIYARGGSTAGSQDNDFGVPGGAGSGGSIILQTAATATLLGSIDVSGGVGNDTYVNSVTAVVCSKGGNGSHGHIRAEVPTLPGNPLDIFGPPGTSIVPDPRTDPAITSVGAFTMSDIDDQVGAQSLWFDTEQLFAPAWLYYEVDATVDGVLETYSDDPNRAPKAAIGPNESVNLYVQGSILDSLTRQPTPGTITPWRRYVGPSGGSELSLQDDDPRPTALRFLLVFNRQTPTQNISIQRVNIAFQPR